MLVLITACSMLEKNVLQMSDEEIENIEQENQEEPPPQPEGEPGSMQASQLSKEEQPQ